MSITDFRPFINKLPNQWDIKAFHEILSEPVKNGVYKTKGFHGSGVKIINMGELFSYNFISHQDMRRIELSDDECKKLLVKNGDLLFARRSLVLEGSGKCSLVVNPVEETTFESSIIRARPNKDKANSRYLFYLFSSPLGRALVIAISSRTAVSGIRGSDLAQIKIPIPPLPTQRKIATILSAYDDLIENNTRRIKFLEEIAQALYREWFVHFRFPGHEGVKMVETEMGLVPEGWEVGRLSSLVETQYGYTESAREEEVGPKFLRGMDINKNSYIQWDQVPYCPIKISEYTKYKLSKGDVVVIRMADPGKVGIVEKNVDAVFASYLIRLRITSKSILPYFLYYYLLSDHYQSYILGASTGTTRKSASAGVMTDTSIILPVMEIQILFEDYVSPMRTMITNLVDKNANLRQTRDLLLPRLISGELDVSEVEVGGTVHE